MLPPGARPSFLLADADPAAGATEGGDARAVRTPLARAAAALPLGDALPPAGLTPLAVLRRDWIVMSRAAVDGAVARLRRPINR